MDASVAAFLENADDAYISDDIQFSDEEDIEQIPEAFHQMLPKTNHNLGVNVNRRRFLQMAPSLMQLIHHGKGGKSLHQPTTINFHGAAHGDFQGTPPTSPSKENADNADIPVISPTNSGTNPGSNPGTNPGTNNVSHLSSPESPRRANARRGGSVVDELLAAQISDITNGALTVNIQELATKAALEFEQLAHQNDELYKESESLMIRYKALEKERDDLESALGEERSKSESLQRQNESMRAEIECFHSEITGLSTRLSNEELSFSGIKSNDDDDGNGNDHTVIAKLQNELLQLRSRVSHQEEDEQQAVQRLMDLEQRHQKMKQELEEEDEYEIVEEEVEVEVTDDDEQDGVEGPVSVSVDPIDAIKEKEKVIETLMMEKEEFERTVSGLTLQVVNCIIISCTIRLDSVFVDELYIVFRTNNC